MIGIDELYVKYKLEGLQISKEAEAIVELWEIVLQEVGNTHKAMKAAQCLEVLLVNLNEDFDK